MTSQVQGQKEKGKRGRVLNFFLLTFSLCPLAVGCQQRMAESPYERPFEENTLFPHGQSSRPLEAGVVHRNQAVGDDPLVTWLTPAAHKGHDSAKLAAGAASFDKNSIVPPLGAPDKLENFVAELPFEMTAADLKRGQTLFNAACALCHGAAGYGDGKIPERGYLRPPSYHVTGAKDWSTMGADGTPLFTELPAGYSRGFYRWGVKVPLKDVPVGYIYQVINWGFGGMGSQNTQVHDPADRWRVAAYVRTLQNSQYVPKDQLPPKAAEALNNQPGAGEKK